MGGKTPTLYEWIGGIDKIQELFAKFYQRVPSDSILAPVFAQMAPEHFQTDPEFRSALVSYLEWGTRIAVINSSQDQNPIDKSAPMPTWGWGEVKGPYQP